MTLKTSRNTKTSSRLTFFFNFQKEKETFTYKLNILINKKRKSAKNDSSTVPGTQNDKTLLNLNQDKILNKWINILVSLYLWDSRKVHCGIRCLFNKHFHYYFFMIHFSYPFDKHTHTKKEGNWILCIQSPKHSYCVVNCVRIVGVFSCFVYALPH